MGHLANKVHVVQLGLLEKRGRMAHQVYLANVAYRESKGCVVTRGNVGPRDNQVNEPFKMP